MVLARHYPILLRYIKTGNICALLDWFLSMRVHIKDQSLCKVKKWICTAAAELDQLKVLKWAIESGFPYTYRTLIRAIRHDNMDCIHYLTQSNNKIITATTVAAAASRSLFLTDLLLRNRPMSVNAKMLSAAGDADTINYLFSRGFVALSNSEWLSLYTSSARKSLDMLQNVHLHYCQRKKALADNEEFRVKTLALLRSATEYGNSVDCIRYAIGHGCDFSGSYLAKAALGRDVRAFEWAKNLGARIERIGFYFHIYKASCPLLTLTNNLYMYCSVITSTNDPLEQICLGAFLRTYYQQQIKEDGENINIASWSPELQRFFFRVTSRYMWWRVSQVVHVRAYAIAWQQEVCERLYAPGGSGRIRDALNFANEFATNDGD